MAESTLEQLRKQLDELTRRMQEVEARVERLDSAQPAAAAPVRRVLERGSEASPEPEAPAVLPGGLLPAGTVGLLGRTLVVLGGAYLLRALHDRELVPPLLALGAALAYAAAWLIQGARHADRGLRTSALFHGATALGIAYPLVLETTLVFDLLTVPVAAGALVALLALAMAVAWRARLRSLAWAAVLAHLCGAFVLMLATRDFLAPALALLAASAVLEVLAEDASWRPLRWPVALGADLALCMLVTSTLRGAAPAAPAIAALLALPSIHLAGAAVRSLGRARPLSTFALVQVPVALAVGLGGSARVQIAQGDAPLLVGAIASALAAGCYAAAFTRIDRRRGRGIDFHAWTSLALLLALTGCPLLLPDLGRGVAAAWSGLAVAAVGAGILYDRTTLRFHGSAYALAAAGASGLLLTAGEGLVGDPTGGRALTPMAVSSGGIAILCCGALLATRAPEASWHARLPQSLLAALVVWSLAGVAARSLAPVLLDAAAEGRAAVAAARTVVVSATAVALAWAGRRWKLRELSWLVPPVLAAGAVKLLLEDLAVGDPVALFVALGAYGGALIATPRLLRASAPSSSAPG